MFNPDFKNKKVNYEMIQASIKSLTFIIILFCIYATCNVIKTMTVCIIIILSQGTVCLNNLGINAMWKRMTCFIPGQDTKHILEFTISASYNQLNL